MILSEYNRDQLHALNIVQDFFKSLPSSEAQKLITQTASYIEFRTVVADFHNKYLSDICTAKCFTGMESACCNKEGIATFFADVVINVLHSDTSQLEKIERQLTHGSPGNKCIYLTNNGCLWQYKPIVCEMFLCSHAKTGLEKKDPACIKRWEKLRQDEKKFTWPDKPVLFDEIEKLFIKQGINSPLMYFHKSPGLLRIKSKWKNI